MISSRTILLVSAFVGFFAFSACNESAKQEAWQVETALSGTITVVCDQEILGILAPAKAIYDREHPNARVSLVSADVLNAMNRILNHQERIAIIARDYIPTEDSAISNDPSDTLPRTLLARDALVFFVSQSFPYDTMNADDIRGWLSGSSDVLSSYPQLKKDPVFVVSGGSNGSIYANIVNVVLKGKLPSAKRIASLGTHDSVVREVSGSVGAIGVGYLSQIQHDTLVKPLRLSYTNPDGTHEWPKPVHVSYLIMGKYPFPVPIYVYIRDMPNQYNLPSGFMQFITRNAAAQKTFLTAGIEPGFGKFSLIMPEE
ncbi:MAG: substrate-binding domain-containing protein [Candidatus Kapabacteria bacterium]|nr:substrate-binding domain-containing protein [Candidatus Kapabacteria bacterium]